VFLRVLKFKPVGVFVEKDNEDGEKPVTNQLLLLRMETPLILKIRFTIDFILVGLLEAVEVTTLLAG